MQPRSATAPLWRSMTTARQSLARAGRGLAAGGRWSARKLRKALLILAALLLAIALLDVLVDEPVRRSIERRTNAALDGYSLAIGEADLSPWNFSLDLDDVVVVQQAHPEPPVLALERLGFSVAWRELLRGDLVADLLLRQPRMHLDIAQLRAERQDEQRIDERGWQQALREAYPLRVNRLLLEDGSLTYIHGEGTEPLVLHSLDGEALDIRNVREDDVRYPSPFRVHGVVFEAGSAAIAGRADFLAEPFPAILATYRISGVPLGALQPFGTDYRLHVAGGRLASRGELELAPDTKRVQIADLVVAGVKIDYVSDPELTRRAVEAVAESNQSDVTIVIADLRLDDSELGFVDRSRDPDYRVFVSGLDVEFSHWTNREGTEPSRFRASGAFMGSGEARLAGVFRPDDDGADFDLAVAIQETRLETMNDLLRAWANLDVVDGNFSFYSELRVADGRIDGYVKPLLSDLDVFDPAQDRDKGFFRKLWERLAGGLANLLENRPRDEVATVADLQGSIEDPNASNLQVVLNLVRNAFFDAILPGFRDRAEKTKHEKDREG